MSARPVADPGHLTPTEELVLDVLAARYRTGAHLWTLDSRVAPAVRRLEAAGLVTSIHGITDNTIRASLTAAGRAAWLSATWVLALDTSERSDVTALLRRRCAELVTQLQAAHDSQDALAATNDQFRSVLGAIHTLVAGDLSKSVARAVQALIAPVKESL
jgi:DNA-binding MarR family transcriptional regulator